MALGTLAQSVAGTTLAISAGQPATQDAAGYAALSFTNVAEVTDVGSLGKKYTLITHNPIANRATYKFRGSFDNGSLAVKLAKALTDAGQTLLKASEASDTPYSFRITLQDGAKMYFSGLNMGMTTNIGTVNNILGVDVEIQITGEIFEVAA